MIWNLCPILNCVIFIVGWNIFVYTQRWLFKPEQGHIHTRLTYNIHQRSIFINAYTQTPKHAQNLLRFYFTWLHNKYIKTRKFGGFQCEWQIGYFLKYTRIFIEPESLYIYYISTPHHQQQPTLTRNMGTDYKILMEWQTNIFCYSVSKGFFVSI